MIYSLMYILLAALALGFLIFIHELGHYFIARKEGMIVEVFAIGFGKPIFSWQRGGVKWQICWLPFGGYVKIAGMEKKGNLEPFEIEGGFFSKSPMARIRVALAGPLVNIFTALLLFTLIWLTGGRYKPFSEYTHLIGWVDPLSQAYSLGVRPGDDIEKINGRPFTGFNALIYAAFLEEKAPVLQGSEIDYIRNQKQPFSITLDAGKNTEGEVKAKATLGLMSPASFLIYDAMNGSNPVQGSPLKEVGLQTDDRIIWVDGELIFSQRQLVQVINQPKTLLTIQRGDKVLLAKVPRVPISDLRLSSYEKSEIHDWLYAVAQSDDPSSFFIPYNMNSECQVEGTTPYINDEIIETVHSSIPRSSLDTPLMKGDKILAVDGVSVQNALDLTASLQKRKIQIIVQKGDAFPAVASKKADETFFKNIDFDGLMQLASSIGIERKQAIGNLCLLPPIEPKPLIDYPLPPSKRSQLLQEIATQKKQIESLKDPQQKKEAMQIFEEHQKKLVLGIQLHDRPVIYNPNPLQMFIGVFDETWKTVKALFTGYLSPKYMSGPVGIVQAIQQGWSTGVNEALYWIAVISLNLGILNLLPIPVLDGGHISISFWEMITKKRLKAKTMERLILPFIVLMLLFFFYATYNDIARLISRFF